MHGRSDLLTFNVEIGFEQRPESFVSHVEIMMGIAVQGLEKRHAAFQPAARPEDAGDFARATEGILHMLQHGDRDHAVEGIVLERQLLANAKNVGGGVVHDLVIDDIAVVGRPVARADVQNQPVRRGADHGFRLVVIAVFAHELRILEVVCPAQLLGQIDRAPRGVQSERRPRQQGREPLHLSCAQCGYGIFEKGFSMLRHALAPPFRATKLLEMGAARGELARSYRRRDVEIDSQIALLVKGLVGRRLLKMNNLQRNIHAMKLKRGLPLS